MYILNLYCYYFNSSKNLIDPHCRELLQHRVLKSRKPCTVKMVTNEIIFLYTVTRQQLEILHHDPSFNIIKKFNSLKKRN